MPSRASCYVPEGTNVKKLCKWGVFPSEDVQLVKRRLCGVDGRGGCKNASTVRGELSFHRFLAKEEQRREWIVKICRKNTPRLHKTPVSVVPTSMEGNVKILFRSCKICVDYYYYKAFEKRAVESRQPCCKVPGRSRDGG